MKRLLEYFRGGGRKSWESRIVAVFMDEPISDSQYSKLIRRLAVDKELRSFAKETAENLELVAETMGTPKEYTQHRLIMDMEQQTGLENPATESKHVHPKHRRGWWPELAGAIAGLLVMVALYPMISDKWMDSMEASLQKTYPVTSVNHIGWDSADESILSMAGERESAPEESKFASADRDRLESLAQSVGPQSQAVPALTRRGVAASVQQAMPAAPVVSPVSNGGSMASRPASLGDQMAVVPQSSRSRVRMAQRPARDNTANYFSPEGSTQASQSQRSREVVVKDARKSKVEVARVSDSSLTVPFGVTAEPGASRVGHDALSDTFSEVSVTNPMLDTQNFPFSTFSLNVSDVAFRLAFAQLSQGKWPARESIRAEEFYNGFEYGDPAPADGQPVGFFAENAVVPFLHGQQLLRFSVKTAGEGREAGMPLNLTLLIDHSGSMVRSDRQRILERILTDMSRVLQENDRLNVITFSTTTSVNAINVKPSELPRIKQQLAEMSPQGGTNLEAALTTGYELAAQRKKMDTINRVILITDGAANLGNDDPQVLQSLVKEGKRNGLFFDVIGVGWEEYNDSLLEPLTKGGDGRYRFINQVEEVPGLLDSLAGAFRPAAQDVKVQVDWNPQQIARYRLIGYTTHRLRDEDFRNDQVDAAEMAANETGNALYLIERKPGGQGPLGTVRVRYRPGKGGSVKEHAWVIPPTVPQDIFSSAPSLQLAAAAAFFAEKLAGHPQAATISLQDLESLLANAKKFYGSQVRLIELEGMLMQATRMQ